mgnify:CR=1 FL=1
MSDYENILELIKICLNFYSDVNNYHNNMISVDKGTQAKFTLDKINEFIEFKQSLNKSTYDVVDNWSEELE